MGILPRVGWLKKFDESLGGNFLSAFKKIEKELR